MRLLVTALACLISVSITAQEQVITYPYNPDADTDSLIAVSDILDLLVLFGTEFIPEPVTVDGVVITEWLEANNTECSNNSYSNRYHIFFADLGYPSYYYTIPDDAGFVSVAAQYGQTWPSIENQPKIRLPQTGLFDGQKIFMFRASDYSDPVGIPIQHYYNNEWVDLTVIQEVQSTSCGGCNFNGSGTNKTFIWTNNSWTVISGAGQQIVAEQ